MGDVGDVNDTQASARTDPRLGQSQLLDSLPIVTPHRLIAEDDIVVVEARGKAMTRTGKPYNNTYCLVYRFADGKIEEITEYCDTALIEAVL